MVQSQGGTLYVSSPSGVTVLPRLSPIWLTAAGGVSSAQQIASYVTSDNTCWMGGTVGDSNIAMFTRFGGASLLLGQIEPVGGALGPLMTTGMSVWNGSSPVYFATLNGWRWRAAYVNDRDLPGTVNAPQWDFYLSGTGATSVAFPIGYMLAYGLANGRGASWLLLFRDQIGQAAATMKMTDAVAVTTAIYKIPIAAGISFLLDTGATTATYLMGGTLPPYKQNTCYPLVDLGILSGTPPQLVNTYFAVKDTGYPTIISVYNNMMFYTGLRKFPSHVFWSRLPIPVASGGDDVIAGGPELVDNDNFNEVRSNDGEVVTCAIPYDGQLIISKKTSLHVVTGDDPDTVSFFEKNTVYGFINNQSACVFENLLWGIDGEGKGIVNYSGANTEIVSNNVQDIFQRINLTAANTEAFMLHVKSRNEVWCGIPVDGSSLVNVIIVYDYVAKCWTTFEGLSPTAVTIARGTLTLPRAVMGFSNGTIRYLNASNSGTEAITTAVRFPFVTNFGWSATEQYRRLFVDTDPILGTTYTFAVNFYLNQSNTAALQTTMTVASQQSRIDYGLPGKGLSVELINGSSHPLRLNGYTIESRFQRGV